MLRYFGYDPWNSPCIKSAPVELGHRSRTQSPTAREGSLALLDAIPDLIPTFLLSPCHRLATKPYVSDELSDIKPYVSDVLSDIKPCISDVLSDIKPCVSDVLSDIKPEILIGLRENVTHTRTYTNAHARTDIIYVIID